MKKIKPFRIALAVFFSLLIFSAVTFVILFIRTDPNKVFDSISEQIEKSVSLRLEAGDVKLDLLKGIELSNVRILDTAGGKSNTLFTFSHGRILYNPIALLWSKIDILSVSASGIKIDFDDLLRSVGNILDMAARSTNSDNSVGVLIRSIAVENSTLVFSGVPFTVKGSLLFGELLDDSILRLEMDSSSGTVTANGRLNSLAVTLAKLDIAKLIGIKEEIVLESVNARLEKGSDTLYRFDGEKCDVLLLSKNLTAATHFSGTFDLGANELRFGGFAVRSGKSVLQLDRFKTSLLRQDVEISVSGIDAELSDFLPGSAGKAYGKFGMRIVSNTVMNGAVDISNAQYLTIANMSGPVMLTNNAVRADLTGDFAGGNFGARVLSQDVFGGAFQANLTLDQLDFFRLTNLNMGAYPVSGDAFPYSVNAQATIGKIVLDKFQTGKSELKLSVKPSGVELLDAQIEFLKGKLAVKGKYSGSYFSGEALLTDGKMKEFTAQLLASGNKLYGTLSGKSVFRIDTGDLYSSTASLELQVKDGEIKDVLIQNRISAVLFDIPLDDIFFDSIDLNAKMSDGFLDVNSLRFVSDNIRLDAKGRMELRRQELAFRSEIYFNREYLSGLPNVAQIFTSGYDKNGQVAFGMTVTGPVKNPSVQIEKAK